MCRWGRAVRRGRSVRLERERLEIVVERKVGEVIEISPSKKEIDGVTAAVAVVSEKEGQALSLTPKQCVAIAGELTSGSDQLKSRGGGGGVTGRR